MKFALVSTLLPGLATILATSADLPQRSQVNEKSSFSLSKPPSGMFYDKTTTLLHVLCGTDTNKDHYLYAYTKDGTEKCLMTIPEAVGMTRVDGFYIVGERAFIVDSQGPIYASTAGKLGGSVYEVEWKTHPCGCTAQGTCSSSSVSWTPKVVNNWALSANEATIGDGGGNDNDFRNSGIVVVNGTEFFAVNGVHPLKGDDLTGSYPKSIVKVDMTAAQKKTAGFAPVVQKWSFEASTLNHEVDMEGLTCGVDACLKSLYVGDEYNFIYKLDFSSGKVTHEWNLGTIVGNTNDDKGIESLAFDGTYFYAGIQGTSYVHQVELTEDVSTAASATSLTSPVFFLMLGFCCLLGGQHCVVSSLMLTMRVRVPCIRYAYTFPPSKSC